MAGLKAAVANGNWSNPATWNVGVLPVAGDTVASNGFTVTIDQDVNVDSLTNAATAPVRVNPVMTGYTTPSGIASASSQYDTTNRQAWKAFDGNSGTTNTWIAGAGQITNSWLAYEFATPIVITSYIISGSFTAAAFPKNWTFEGWNGSTWTVLHTVTGNTATSYTGNFTNTTAYIKYRIYITLNNGDTSYLSINEMYLYDAGHYTATTVAGGGFVANSTVTINCTGNTGITGAVTTAPLTVSAASPSVVTVNSNITNCTVDNSRCISKTGNCTLNITGSTFLPSSGTSRNCLEISASGTTNFIGNVRGLWQGSNGIKLITGSAGAVLNVTGNVNPDKSLGVSQNLTCIVVQTICTVNITGNIYGDYGNSNAVSLTAAATLYVTGSIYGGNNAGSFGNGAAINTNQAAYINIVGAIYAQHTLLNSATGLTSTNSSAINLCSGPFVCSPEGFYPLAVIRMHLIPSIGTYFEFRDETTNGALPPAAAAPATCMVAPASIVDAPAPANVRFGTIYANGSQTGTCKIPATNTVAAGVEVDNTVGSAVLSPSDVWDAQISTMTTAGSIGLRLKNTSTVDTTGDQIAAFL